MTRLQSAKSFVFSTKEDEDVYINLSGHREIHPESGLINRFLDAIV